mmetsp:Transcript_33706/g.100377  ORF Transcript_33706/g.100377 Transcript_33706/m.100377 type:complete len:104 (+) Transcript_33706:1922-2233(+)
MHNHNNANRNNIGQGGALRPMYVSSGWAAACCGCAAIGGPRGKPCLLGGMASHALPDAHGSKILQIWDRILSLQQDSKLDLQQDSEEPRNDDGFQVHTHASSW